MGVEAQELYGFNLWNYFHGPIQHKISDGLGVGEATATNEVDGATKLRQVKEQRPSSTSLPTVTLPLQHTFLYYCSVI
jgi:hypothetical protein